MPNKPHRLDEATRLRCLRSLRILDTPPEEFSDSVAALAASIANAPISAVSLVDEERQWFKSSCGLSISETGRDVALCAYTVLDRVAFIVPDTRADARFSANPLVVGPPHIRFYAGFPLLVGGQAIGSLCVIDDRPRALSSVQVTELTDLADGAAAWLALTADRRA